MSKDLAAYNITVRKVIFEGEECFEALVKELPDVAEYGVWRVYNTERTL